MDALNLRQQTGKPSYCLIVASIAMLALPVTSFADAGNDGPARISQYTQEDAATNARIIEKSLVAPETLQNHQDNNTVITQVGNDNVANVSQHRTGNYSAGNMAWLYQNGYNNSVDISQTGRGHVGIVYQQGKNLTAAINQVGNGYGSAVYQTGINAEATIHQAGNSDQGISVEQFSRSGTGMSVTITVH